MKANLGCVFFFFIWLGFEFGHITGEKGWGFRRLERARGLLPAPRPLIPDSSFPFRRTCLRHPALPPTVDLGGLLPRLPPQAGWEHLLSEPRRRPGWPGQNPWERGGGGPPLPRSLLSWLVILSREDSLFRFSVAPSALPALLHCVHCVTSVALISAVWLTGHPPEAGIKDQKPRL